MRQTPNKYGEPLLRRMYPIWTEFQRAQDAYLRAVEAGTSPRLYGTTSEHGEHDADSK